MQIFDKIKNKISHIQSLSEKEKEKIIWIMAILIVALIAALWIGFFRNYEISDNGDANNKEIENLKKNLEKQFNDKFEGKISVPEVEIPISTPSATLEPSPSPDPSPEASSEATTDKSGGETDIETIPKNESAPIEL